MNILNFKHVLMGAALILSVQANAEDVDLFLGSIAGAGAPNVLIILDNTANWGPEGDFQIEKDALRNIFLGMAAPGALDEKDVNVGLMMFTETGGGNHGEPGAYMRAAIRPMETGDNGSAALYGAMVESFTRLGDVGNGGKGSLSMAEAYHYYKGLTPNAGDEKLKTDYAGNNYNFKSCCEASHPVWNLSGNALPRFSGANYISPIDPSSCARNYIIYISNGAVQDDNNGRKKAIALLEAQLAGASQPPVPVTVTGSEDMVVDEWARFMKQSALGITTYTIDVEKETTGQGPGWTNVLQNMATVSGGEYFEAGTDNLDLVFFDVLNKILAVNSVFASVALPAASNAQSTFLNRVYIGQFRPDEDLKPRWPGNLKHYKLGLVGTEVKVLDAKEKPIIERSTGFIRECAQSYWTPDGTDTYWSFDPEPKGKCVDSENGLTLAITQPSNTPDGPIVEKGGQAYTIRARDPDDRIIYTCSPDMADCSSTPGLTKFDTSNGAITGALLDPNNPTALSDTDIDKLINWARGQDLQNEDKDSNTPLTRTRPSVHGDIVHSRPVAVNYGTDDTPNIVVYYGGNDGMLRAINANRPVDDNGDTDADAGKELWTFMPPEFYSSLKRLFDNTLLLNVPASGQSAGTGGATKSYGMDGPITAFEGSAEVDGDWEDDQVYLYASMRRSGRVMYAFDVTDPEKAPKMLWKIGCPNLDNNTGCAGARSEDNSLFNDIGQTWSTPNVIYSAGYTDGDTDKPRMKPMLIMGGGYDDCEDFDDNDDTSGVNHLCDSVNNGKAVYLLDAVTGSVLQKFTTERAVVGEIRTVTVSELSTAASYAYVADTGGNLYRISGGTAATNTNPGLPEAIGTTEPGDDRWVMSKIASLGCGGKANDTCSAPRKFLFGPDAVRIPLSTQIGILLGSGDREKPVLSYGAAHGLQNYFFSLIDDPTHASSHLNLQSDCGYDQICLDELTIVATGKDVVPVTPISSLGFALPLTDGEQVVSGALTIADIVNFSTHIPSDPEGFDDPNSPDFCKNNLGTATVYNIDYQDAEGDRVNIIGGGLVPTPVAGKVILDDGSIVPFCIGCGGDNSAIGGSSVGSGVTWIQPKSRVYWNIQQ